MPRPTTGKFTVKATRNRDIIEITDSGITGVPLKSQPTQAQISEGIIINADAGDDHVTGGRGADELNGGAGGDTLIGGSGLDRLNGGAGDDVLIDLDELLADADTGDNVDPNANRGAFFDGGRGIDTIDFSNSTVGVAVSLDGYIWTDFSVEYVGDRLVYSWTPQSGLQRIANVENLIGSPFNDFLAGSGAANEIHGGAGDDAIWGADFAGSDDRLFGDEGRDELNGALGNDTLTGGADGDTFLFDGSSPAGTDVILDYDKAEGDRLVFQFQDANPVWSTRDHDGDGILDGVLTHSTGQVILLSESDFADVTMIVLPSYW